MHHTHPPQTAQECVALNRYESAALVLALASPWAGVFEEVAVEADSPLPKRLRYCGLVFDAGKPDTCPVGAVGCNEILAESE